MELPGIGRSTAGAILTFSMHQALPILDGKVKRVLCRFYAVTGSQSQNSVIKKLWDISEELTPSKQTHHYNQAMMDLGATLCTRTKPLCQKCPLESDCQAYRTNRVSDFPEKKLKKTRPIKKTKMLILQNTQGELLLQKRPSSGIWGGLWSFPECDIHDDDLQCCMTQFGLSIQSSSSLPVVTHQFSHFQLNIHPILLKVEPKTHAVMESLEQVWYKQSDPLPGGVAAPVKTLLETFNDAESAL